MTSSPSSPQTPNSHGTGLLQVLITKELLPFTRLRGEADLDRDSKQMAGPSQPCPKEI